MTHVATAVLGGLILGVLAFAASGCGRAMLAGCRLCSPWRTIAGESLVGFLGYAVLLGALAHIGATYWIAVAIVVAYFGLGAAALVRDVRIGNAQLRPRLILAIGVALSLVASGAVPVNQGALDPLTYAFASSALFQDNWLTTQLAQLSSLAWLRDTLQDAVFSRVPSVALLWPSTVFALGLGSRAVAGAAAWMLGLSVILIVDLLPAWVPPVGRVLLAIASIGVFNLTAVLTGGQINQPFALVAAISIVWFMRWVPSVRHRMVPLGLGCASITAGYPEFAPAVPMYVVCGLLQRPLTRRGGVLVLAALLAGVAVVQLSSRLGNAIYLLAQVDVRPGWWPVDSDPRNVLEVWTAMLVQRSLPGWGYALALLAALISFALLRRRARVQSAPGPAIMWALASTALLVVAWTVLVLRDPNPNYATFKLGGWTGPALMLTSLTLVPYARPLLQPVLLGVVVAFASARLLGLALDTPGKWLLYQPDEQRSAWLAEQDAARCLIHASSDTPEALMTAIAESSAPRRDCSVRVP